jgi:hypothetical protein
MDEVLKIQVHDIQFLGEDEPDRILNLIAVSQDTSVWRSVKLIFLPSIHQVLMAIHMQTSHLLSSMPFLNRMPISALFKHYRPGLEASGITQGFLFCKISSGD